MAKMAFALPAARTVLQNPTQAELHALAKTMPNARETSYGAVNIQTQVLYPNIGVFQVNEYIGMKADPALVLECVRAYNDFLIDWCNTAPNRYVPLLTVPFWDMDEAVKELHRAADLGWFPGGGRLGIGVEPPPRVTGLYTVDALLAGQWSTFTDALDHLVLPALVLAAFNVSLLTRYTRSSVLEVVGNDYVRAARAKGLPESIVVTRYVLRAALPAVVTVIGLLFANILTGAVLVENIFSWPGVGQYAYISAINLDVQAIAGVSLFVAIVYVTINFIVDVLYGIIDPRIRLT